MDLIYDMPIESELFTEVLIKLSLAVVLAGLLGLERELRGRAAGLRTHILVCLGATLAMIVSEQLAIEINGQDSIWRLDAGRIAAGIITGVGFLGAGTIINIRNTQVGLTTAALIWFSASLGIAIGAGLYTIAAMATAVALLVVLCFRVVIIFLPTARRLRMSIRLPKEQINTHEMAKFLKKKGFKVDMSHAVFSIERDKVDLTFDLTISTNARLETLVELLEAEFGGVERVFFEA